MGFTVGTGHWCRLRSKDFLKAQSFLPRFPPFGSAGLFQRTIFPTVTCVHTLVTQLPLTSSYIFWFLCLCVASFDRNASSLSVRKRGPPPLRTEIKNIYLDVSCFVAPICSSVQPSWAACGYFWQKMAFCGKKNGNFSYVFSRASLLPYVLLILYKPCTVF